MFSISIKEKIKECELEKEMKEEESLITENDDTQVEMTDSKLASPDSENALIINKYTKLGVLEHKLYRYIRKGELKRQKITENFGNLCLKIISEVNKEREAKEKEKIDQMEEDEKVKLAWKIFSKMFVLFFFFLFSLVFRDSNTIFSSLYLRVDFGVNLVLLSAAANHT